MTTVEQEMTMGIERLQIDSHPNLSLLMDEKGDKMASRPIDVEKRDVRFCWLVGVIDRYQVKILRQIVIQSIMVDIPPI
jgi:hypothetical protein